MNTRVSITTNGRIHLGHVAMIALNEQTAHRSGGLFHVRFDDGQPLWISLIGMEQQRVFAESIKQDLEWLGIRVDSYSSEYDSKEHIKHDVELLVGNYPVMNGNIAHDYEQAVYRNVSYMDPALYPLAPWLTAEKVILDHHQGITHVIRGEELMTEASLYAWFCHKMSYPFPVQWFVPRLRTADGNDLSDVSKTKGNCKVHDLRSRGIRPDRVHYVMSNAFLETPGLGWSVGNVKQSPVLHMEAFQS